MGFGVLLETAALSDWHTTGWHLASERQQCISTYSDISAEPNTESPGVHVYICFFFGGAVMAVTEAWSSRSDVVSVL